MKQFIVLISTVLLGVAIYNMVAGPGDDCIKNTTMKVFQYQIENQETYP